MRESPGNYRAQARNGKETFCATQGVKRRTGPRHTTDTWERGRPRSRLALAACTAAREDWKTAKKTARSKALAPRRAECEVFDVASSFAAWLGVPMQFRAGHFPAGGGDRRCNRSAGRVQDALGEA